MLRVDVRLAFSCQVCENSIRCTLRCEGAGLATEEPVAAVPVKCPYCRARNYVTFAPCTGEVVDVLRMQEFASAACN